MDSSASSVPQAQGSSVRLLSDEGFMEHACALARCGEGWVSPNPQVGCVLVRDGQVIGQGWHQRFGGLHAEREALADCERQGQSAQGATAYVTLEPCAHTGKQPPCADALIEAGVARVVVGSADPNPLVAGKGIERLRSAGVQVEEGVAREACDRLNAPFFHVMETGMPYVIAKFAETLDGKVATHTGASRWITGEAAREKVHEDRARFAAIMVGVGTVMADDPMLTARPQVTRSVLGVHQPLRVVADTHLRTPLGSKLVQTARDCPTCIVTSVQEGSAFDALVAAGCQMIAVPERDGHVDLPKAVRALGERGIDSIIIEGGPQLLGAAFDAQLPNLVQAYLAPKIFGNAAAPGPVAGAGISLPSDALVLRDVRCTPLAPDLLIEATLA